MHHVKAVQYSRIYSVSKEVPHADFVHQFCPPAAEESLFELPIELTLSSECQMNASCILFPAAAAERTKLPGRDPLFKVSFSLDYSRMVK
jgi:hypothetical protein